jgi:nicotinate-nucleotide adenylyltransferase
MTLALFGGSFNPPHNGHVALARHALETLRPDKLIWMPSGDPPHKALPEGSPSAAHRLAMSRLAAEGVPRTEVSDFEIMGGARYTIDTVKTLLERDRPDKLWLLMGQDMRDCYHTWYGAEELSSLCEPFVVSRETVPVSSTEIRASLDGSKVPAKVWAYIRKEGLYGCPKP